MNLFYVIYLSLALTIVFCKDYEFTFEVPDNKEQCFYEDIDLNQEVEVEFQVLVGGKNDIDMVIHGPGQTLIQTYRRKQQETYKFKTVDRGQYVFCFNNEFSSFTHKVVYFYLGIGEEESLTEEMSVKATALTQVMLKLLKRRKQSCFSTRMGWGGFSKTFFERFFELS